MTTYREYKLEPPLDGLVQCVWFLAQPATSASRPAVQRIPPDGTVEVIFHLGDAFLQVADGAETRQPAAMIVGVWTRSIALLAPPGFDTVGVRIKAGSASSFWGERLDSFTDQVVDATAVWGRDAADVRERLGETRSTRERLAIIDDFLRTRLRRQQSGLTATLARIAASHGCVSIDGLAAGAGVSARQLERACRVEVGVSPKMLCRIVRFQHALARSRRLQATYTWADVAADCGYADQSHLIRDFTQFAGETPTALIESAATVADYFRRR